VQSVPITTKAVSSNPTHGNVYSIQQYVIKFVSDLQQVCDFLRARRFLCVAVKFNDYLRDLTLGVFCQILTAKVSFVLRFQIPIKFVTFVSLETWKLSFNCCCLPDGRQKNHRTQLANEKCYL